jgi:hypothetical protein
VNPKGNNIASADAWRSASQAVRLGNAERLELPSGATILAVHPEPLEWILAGRLPQRLLSVALEGQPDATHGAHREISRDEILDLARFAIQLVKATVVEPRIGEGPGEISLEEIPIQDRAFIFEWACRTWSENQPTPQRDKNGNPNISRLRARKDETSEEEVSIPANGIERFCPK